MPIGVKRGERETDFVNRCIPVEMEAGYGREQAAAICYSIYRREKMSKISDTREKVSARIKYDTDFRGINLKEPGDPCWEGYEMIGMKDDGTPNCVPIKKD